MAPRIAAQALKLPEAQRAALVIDLIDSLSPEIDPEAGKLWEAELLRRAEEARSGSVRSASWASVERRVTRRLQAVKSARLKTRR